MATKTTRVCDVCGKETGHIVAKLFYVPIVKGVSSRTVSNYTHRLDVGSCCSLNSGRNRFLKILKWRQRQTKEEYDKVRSNGA